MGTLLPIFEAEIGYYFPSDIMNTRQTEKRRESNTCGMETIDGTVVITVPKKRRYVDPSIAETTVAERTSTKKEKSFSETKNDGKDGHHGRPLNLSHHKSSVTIEQSRTPAAATATDYHHQPEKRRRKTRKDNEKESQSSAAKEISSVKPDSEKPTTIKTGLNFWMRSEKGDFGTREFEQALKQEFTVKQSKMLRDLCYYMSRKASCIQKHNTRFMKTHKCIECDFSISHQCISLNSIQHIANFRDVSLIAPEAVYSCICSFGLYHSHKHKPRSKFVGDLRSMNIYNLIEKQRYVDMNCPKCYLEIRIHNRNDALCNNFTNWTNLEDGTNGEFCRIITKNLNKTNEEIPLLNELYSCNRRCCLLFHRCEQQLYNNSENNG